jgi:hypothetical protein
MPTKTRKWFVNVPLDETKPPVFMATDGFGSGQWYVAQTLEYLTCNPIDWHILETMVWSMDWQLDMAMGAGRGSNQEG